MHIWHRHTVDMEGTQHDCTEGLCTLVIDCSNDMLTFARSLASTHLCFCKRGQSESQKKR
jgi:hypothetical protein